MEESDGSLCYGSKPSLTSSYLRSSDTMVSSLTCFFYGGISAFVGLLTVTVALLADDYPSLALLFDEESLFANLRLESWPASLVGDNAVLLEAEFYLFGPAESGLFCIYSFFLSI